MDEPSPLQLQARGVGEDLAPHSKAHRVARHASLSSSPVAHQQCASHLPSSKHRLYGRGRQGPMEMLDRASAASRKGDAPRRNFAFVASETSLIGPKRLTPSRLTRPLSLAGSSCAFGLAHPSGLSLIPLRPGGVPKITKCYASSSRS
ncbi:hypothetical protein LIA77_10121 [Sarocladium implicatum]|nr:hypothetical protein LIA77_10121 [Sarocladium implicatum]